MAGQHGNAELHLLNAPLPILSGHARMFLSKQDVQNYYDEEGEKALADARQAAEQAGVPFVTAVQPGQSRSEVHTSELQALMRNSYAVFCLNTKKHEHTT